MSEFQFLALLGNTWVVASVITGRAAHWIFGAAVIAIAFFSKFYP